MLLTLMLAAALAFSSSAATFADSGTDAAGSSADYGRPVYVDGQASQRGNGGGKPMGCQTPPCPPK